MNRRSFMAGIVAVSCSGAFAGMTRAQSPQTHDHSFSDAAEWAKIFDDPKRDAWQKPHEVIQALALKPDAVIADIGAGTGYFSSRLAGDLKPGGRVAIIDFRMDSPEGPPQAARIEPERVKAEMRRAGYELAQEHAFLPRQYFLVFQPSKR